MAFTLDNVVPWGRNLDEYSRMFALSKSDMSVKILDCAGGPSSFNRELTEKGGTVMSCDPLYGFSRDEIEGRIGETYGQVMSQLERNRGDYVWREFDSPEALGDARMAAMRLFLEDLDNGKKEGRYLPHALPRLPFESGSFGLALCSHFLFTYSGHLDLQFHRDSISEMCRVAGEARVFPVLDIGGGVSEHLEPLLETLEKGGLIARLVDVNYEFQKGARRMLSVTRHT